MYEANSVNLFSAEILARFFKNKGFWCCEINTKTWISGVKETLEGLIEILNKM